MKRFTAILCLLALLVSIFTFAACHKKDTVDVTDADAAVYGEASNATVAPTTAPTTEAPTEAGTTTLAGSVLEGVGGIINEALSGAADIVNEALAGAADKVNEAMNGAADNVSDSLAN